MALTAEEQEVVDRVTAMRGDGVDKPHDPVIDKLILLAAIAEAFAA